MNQLSLFEEVRYWIPQVDNDCRMWECPVCHKRMTGPPLGWYQFNYYRFCPHCGTRLRTERKYVTDENGLPKEEEDT